ncbi:MAG: PepSY domain-containing protein [Reyranella sp.]|nr:PepSY domain-containing protein [Reyranella sp.]
MFHFKVIPAALAAIVALGATQVAFAKSGEHESGKEIAAVLGAKTSAAQAIAAAEQKTGGRAMKIDVEKEKGAYLYEVKTVAKDKISEVFVDLASGQVTRTDDEGLIGRIFDREDRDEFAKLAALPTTLAAAIATAEQHTNGKAIKAGFDDENGVLLFKVEVAKDNSTQRVKIDSATGKVIKVSTAEDGENED